MRFFKHMGAGLVVFLFAVVLCWLFFCSLCSSVVVVRLLAGGRPATTSFSCWLRQKTEAKEGDAK
jgi:hypothetical protein